MPNNVDKGPAEPNDLKEDGRSLENGGGQDIDALIALLDGYTEAGDSRIKVDVVEGQGYPSVPSWTLRCGKPVGLRHCI